MDSKHASIQMYDMRTVYQTINISYQGIPLKSIHIEIYLLEINQLYIDLYINALAHQARDPQSIGLNQKLVIR